MPVGHLRFHVISGCLHYLWPHQRFLLHYFAAVFSLIIWWKVKWRTAFNIAYWHRKYHSGTICKGVSNPQTSNALSGCEKEEIPKWVWRRYRQRIRMKPKKSFRKMKGKNGILLFVFNLKGLDEEWKWR